MIIDCFPFFNELDILEIRLNSLAPYVDRFVLSEMDVTFSGNPKRLYFHDYKNRFKDFPIIHIMTSDDGKYKPIHGKLSGDAWRLEHFQRERLMLGLSNCKDDDIILLSDLDEIPNLEGWDGQEGAFRHECYYYYLNCKTNQPIMDGTQSCKFGNIKTLTHLRNHRHRRAKVESGIGWHFSMIGDVEKLIYKIESYAHTELDTEEFKGSIRENYDNLIDPYKKAFETSDNWNGYPKANLQIEMPSGPKWLLDNKDKYEHLFYGNN